VPGSGWWGTPAGALPRRVVSRRHISGGSAKFFNKLLVVTSVRGDFEFVQEPGSRLFREAYLVSYNLGALFRRLGIAESPVMI